MTDVRINYRSSADTAALKDTARSLREIREEAEATKESAARLGEAFLQVAKEGVHTLIDVVKESVELFKEQDRADRQLKQVAGELTDIFKEQAETFEKTLGVQKETIEGLQTMALRFGAAPRDIEATTEAVLNYAAATGQDAETAMRKLVIGIENGGKGLAKLGIHYQATGNFSRDLALATAQLGERFAGAAKANAESFAGQMDILHRNTENVEKAFGQIIIAFEQKVGVVKTLSEAMEGLAYWSSAEAKSDSERVKRTVELSELRDKESVIVGRLKADDAARAKGRSTEFDFVRTALQRELADLKAEEAQLKRNMVAASEAATAMAKKDNEAKALFAKQEGAGDTGKAEEARAKALKELDKEYAKSMQAMDDYAHEVFRNDRELEDHQAELDKKKAEKAEKEVADLEKKVWESNSILNKALAEQDKEIGDMFADVGKNVDSYVAENTHKFAEAGTHLGVAFINAFGKQMKSVKDGGAFDVGDIAKTIIPIAVGLLATYYGGPAAGQLAGAGASAIMSSFHEGGWVGQDGRMRFHEGGEVPAVLLEGERVLSHKEINRMGGNDQVDRMATGGRRGPGGITLQVQTLDATSFQNYLGGSGGSGFIRAVVQGRGEMAQLLRRMKRGT